MPRYGRSFHGGGISGGGGTAAALSITFNPANSTSIADTTAVRTVVLTMQGVWSPARAFGGSYEFVAPNYDSTGAPVSGVSVVNAGSNYILGDAVSSGDTTSITSTGTYAIVRCPNSLGCVIINPNGPGVSASGGSTDDISVDAYE